MDGCRCHRLVLPGSQQANTGRVLSDIERQMFNQKIQIWFVSPQRERLGDASNRGQRWAAVRRSRGLVPWCGWAENGPPVAVEFPKLREVSSEF